MLLDPITIKKETAIEIYLSGFMSLYRSNGRGRQGADISQSALEKHYRAFRHEILETHELAQGQINRQSKKKKKTFKKAKKKKNKIKLNNSLPPLF